MNYTYLYRTFNTSEPESNELSSDKEHQIVCRNISGHGSVCRFSLCLLNTKKLLSNKHTFRYMFRFCLSLIFASSSGGQILLPQDQIPYFLQMFLAQSVSCLRQTNKTTNMGDVFNHFVGYVCVLLDNCFNQKRLR